MLTLGSTQPGQLRLLPSVWAKWGWGKGHEGVQNWAGAGWGGVGGERKGETEPLLGTFRFGLVFWIFEERHWSVIFSIFFYV